MVSSQGSVNPNFGLPGTEWASSGTALAIFRPNRLTQSSESSSGQLDPVSITKLTGKPLMLSPGGAPIKFLGNSRSRGSAETAIGCRQRKLRIASKPGRRVLKCISSFAGLSWLQPAAQTSPSFILPSSEIICWFHGGSQVMRTSASDTPGTRRIFDLASSAMAGPMPQPGAVSVMVTSTR